MRQDAHIPPHQATQSQRGSVIVVIIIVVVIIVIIIVIIIVVVVIVVVIIVVVVIVVIVVATATRTIIVPIVVIVIVATRAIIVATATRAIIVPIIVIVIVATRAIVVATAIRTIVIPIVVVVVTTTLSTIIPIEPVLEAHLDLEPLTPPEGRSEGGEIQEHAVDLDDQPSGSEEGVVPDGIGARRLDDDVDEASDAAQQVELQFDCVALDLDLADAHQSVPPIEDGEAELGRGGVEDEGGEQRGEQRAQGSGHRVSSFEHHETPGP